MGKINKKLPKPQLDFKPPDDGNKIKGPFPIYRTKPIQLHCPESKKGKIQDSKPAPKVTTKRADTPKIAEEVLTKSMSISQAQGDGQKMKKLRKLAISRVSKKEKKQFRKEEMLKKVELTQRAFKEDRLRKKREKMAITGDLRPLLDALPSLDSLYDVKSSIVLKTGVPKFDKKVEPKTKKERRAQRLKVQKRQFLKRCSTIKRVLKDTTFKKDPQKMVADHIRNTRKEQLELLMQNAS
ncbi:ribosome biogenesis protein SLX9 homolog [Anopheles nili]|uniref:ribosome biogenesis protein SLX9 homolog n=1 Tax=Anopheles nili TaxID=185578 RepID=UPI00237BC303|nr:ribosome biogenesis protein SLX9 homolog [Anopheles nili]